MKAFILVAAAVLFCMVSCKKSDPLSPALFGKWEVSRQYGGFIIPSDSVYKPGNGHILQFNSDSTYKRYEAGSVTATGTFHIRKNGFKADSNSYNVIYFGNDTTFKTLISLMGNKLTLKPLIPDVGSTDYQKISD